VKKVFLAIFLLIFTVGIVLAENNTSINQTLVDIPTNITNNSVNTTPTATPTPTQTPANETAPSITTSTQTPTPASIPTPTPTTPVKEEGLFSINFFLGLLLGLLIGLVAGLFTAKLLGAGEVNLRIEKKEKSIEIEVVDAETGEAIPNAEVLVEYGRNTKHERTNRKGICKIKVPEYWNSAVITVKKEGYIEYKKKHTLTKSVNVALKPERYRLQIKVVDDSGKPIDNAVVKIEGVEERTTDSTGIAVFNLKKGNYTVRVSKGDYHPIERTVSLNSNETVEIKLSKKVGTLIFEAKDKFGYLEGIEIDVGGYKAITDSNGYARLTLPVGSYTAYVRDTFGVYSGSSIPVEVKEDAEEMQTIVMKTPSNEIQAFAFRSIESAMNEFEGTVKSQIPSETYDQELVRYFEALSRGLKMLGDELKNNVGILRRRYGKSEAVLGYFEEVNTLASSVIRSMREILTSREGLYLLYDIKRFRVNILESIVDLNEKMREIIEKALELELKGAVRDVVENLSIEVDREITEAMRKGINGYFFSSLYKVYRGLSVKQAYVVPFLLLSTIKLMLNTHSIRDKLKGLTG
jgi:hypothetical protein